MEELAPHLHDQTTARPSCESARALGRGKAPPPAGATGATGTGGVQPRSTQPIEDPRPCPSPLMILAHLHATRPCSGSDLCTAGGLVGRQRWAILAHPGGSEVLWGVLGSF